MAGFTDKSFELLTLLGENNDRDWFKAHKDDFDQWLLGPFARTLELISEKLEAEDMPFRGGKQTMFRMHRDVRFSKDKSPYKTNVSGLLTPGGNKREAGGFAYLHLEADGGFAAYGRYNLAPKELGPIRDRIIDEPETFGSILEGLRAEGLDLMRDMSLSSMPRGYAEHADHPFAEELKLKSMCVSVELPASDWTNGDVVERVAKNALICRDFISFVSP